MIYPQLLYFMGGFLSGWCYILCEEFIYCISCHALIDSFLCVFYLFFFFNQSGSSRSHWAQRRQRRWWPSRETIISQQIAYFYRRTSCTIRFLLTPIYFPPFSNRDHVGCQVLQGLMEKQEKRWEYFFNYGRLLCCKYFSKHEVHDDRSLF